MKKAEQIEFVVEKLKINKKLEIDEMTGLLGVSESTVRRIFNNIEETGKAVRTHGGITLISAAPDYSFDDLIQTKRSEKTAIGCEAAGQIENNDIIYLDCGTTVLAMCIKLAQFLKSGKLKNIQLFTNSLANLEILSPVTQINLIGGRYRENRKDFAGYMSLAVLKGLHFTKCFMGADAVDGKFSFKTTDFDTAALCQIVINNSSKNFVLCDSSKFGKTALVSYADLDAVNVIITDSGLDPQITGNLISAGTEIILANLDQQGKI